MLKILRFRTPMHYYRRLLIGDRPFLEKISHSNQINGEGKYQLIKNRSPKNSSGETVVFLKANKANEYSLPCVQHWVDIAGELQADIYLVCDNDFLRQEILTKILFPHDRLTVMRSKRFNYRKIIDNFATEFWKNATYANLTIIDYANAHSILRYWIIDADDTMLLCTPKHGAEILSSAQQYALQNKVAAFSFDMHTSRSYGKHWSFGVTFINSPDSDIYAAIAGQKDNSWMQRYRHLDIDSNLDWYFTYLRDYHEYNFLTFYAENFVFLHAGNFLISPLWQGSIACFEDGYILYPFIKFILNNYKYAQVPICEKSIKVFSFSNEDECYGVLNDKFAGFNRLSTQNHNLYDSESMNIMDLGMKYKYAFDDLKRIVPQPILENLEYHLCEHCNLNCARCDHFSPLAQKSFESLENFERDLCRFSALSKKRLQTLKLLGGEPLLHPQIEDFLKISRAYFPDSKVMLITNGIKLLDMQESFFQSCHNYNITISPTKYPISLPWAEIENKIKKFSIMFEYYNSANVVKTSYHLALDLSGKQNPVQSFMNCFHANNCVLLREGKIYRCPIVPNIHHFNAFFGKNLKVSEEDAIDIFKVDNYSDISHFLSTPGPFCRYCDTPHRTYGHKWRISKKSIEEWASDGID